MGNTKDIFDKLKAEKEAEQKKQLELERQRQEAERKRLEQEKLFRTAQLGEQISNCIKKMELILNKVPKTKAPDFDTILREAYSLFNRDVYYEKIQNYNRFCEVYNKLDYLGKNLDEKAEKKRISSIRRKKNLKILARTLVGLVVLVSICGGIFTYFNSEVYKKSVAIKKYKKQQTEVISNNISLSLEELSALEQKNENPDFQMFIVQKYAEKEDYENALKYAKKAANLNNTEAQYFVGESYYNGIGTDVDYTEARKWFLLAAENDFADAQNSLGLIYSNGTGVKVDYATAFDWFSKSAKQHNSKGEFLVGCMYYLGQGVKKDIFSAKKWLQKSSEHGYEASLELLNDENFKRDLIQANAEKSSKVKVILLIVGGIVLVVLLFCIFLTDNDTLKKVTVYILFPVIGLALGIGLSMFINKWVQHAAIYGVSFLSDSEPIKLWELTDGILGIIGLVVGVIYGGFPGLLIGLLIGALLGALIGWLLGTIVGMILIYFIFAGGLFLLGITVALLIAESACW